MCRPLLATTHVVELEQRVNEWSCCGAGQQQECAQGQQNQDDWPQPPLLVRHQELQKLSEDRSISFGFSDPGKVLVWVFFGHRCHSGEMK